MLVNKNFIEYIQKEIKSKEIREDRLAIMYKCLGDEINAKELFENLAGINYPKSRFWSIGEEDKNDNRLLIQVGDLLIITGIQLNLSKTYPQKATQLFEWAAKNCYQSEEDIAAALKYRLYGEIAVGYLWRGYALMNLGNYDEAHELLTQVIPYLTKQKKKGIEMWRKVEYALPKALIPLCEYKLEPNPENLQKAQSGVEDYIKSLRENKHKLEGYLYYFHLKEMFPEVYNAEIAETPAKKSPKKKTIKKLDLPPGESDTEGSVIVFDIKGGYLDVFG
ncbi:MAG: hypothetical protein KAR76_06580, partial [Methanosarcinales archaeon]|nr:hypothetical protein [Methanosarcinales archaeon]